MGKIFFYLAFLIIGPMTVYFDGIALKNDFSMKSETLIQAPIPTSERKCTSISFVVQRCGFKYELDGVENSKTYTMLGFRSPKTVHLMMGLESGRLTSTVGQEYVWNRLITMLIGMFISGFTALAMLSAFRRMGHEKSAPQAVGYQAQPQSYAPQGGASAGQAQGFGQRTGFQS